MWIQKTEKEMDQTGYKLGSKPIIYSLSALVWFGQVLNATYHLAPISILKFFNHRFG